MTLTCWPPCPPGDDALSQVVNAAINFRPLFNLVRLGSSWAVGAPLVKCYAPAWHAAALARTAVAAEHCPLPFPDRR